MTGKRDIRRELANLELQHDITAAVLVERVSKFLESYHTLGIRYHYNDVMRIEEVTEQYKLLMNKIQGLTELSETDVQIGENVIFPPANLWDRV